MELIGCQKISKVRIGEMITRFLAFGVISLFLTACAGEGETYGDVLIISRTPANAQDMILLQEVNTGDLVCCQNTYESTAEECAYALEQTDCYVRVQDIPYRTAKYDYLTTGTYPTRRWRENETSPRW